MPTFTTLCLVTPRCVVCQCLLCDEWEMDDNLITADLDKFIDGKLYLLCSSEDHKCQRMFETLPNLYEDHGIIIKDSTLRDRIDAELCG